MNTKLLVIGGLAVVVGGGLIAWNMMRPARDTMPAQSNDQQMTNPPPAITNSQTSTQPITQELLWQQSEGGWQSMGTPPACPTQPMMAAPADLSLATEVLYPGQTRGGNYKPHGGLRFDNSTNDDIAVTAPADGYLLRGSRYLEMGEVQYSFDIMHNCGVMYRFDHLRELSAKMQAIADTFPAAVDDDSQTHSINPPVSVTKSETLATSVGFIKNKNVSLDWGVYDFRSENEASAAAAFKTAHTQDKELSWHAVCWFDWLPAGDALTVRGLPAGDAVSGKTSDYCK
ncbi:MAG: hypothetical protein AAB701_03155 [Patescibacteria group bacterium]